MAHQQLIHAANCRGRAYRCLHCPKIGRPEYVAEKGRVEAHVYKHHVQLDRVPYSCSSCLFHCVTEEQYTRYLKSYSWHNQWGNAEDLPLVSQSPYIIGEDDMQVLTKEESVQHFLKRSRSIATIPEPVETGDILYTAVKQSLLAPLPQSPLDYEDLGSEDGSEGGAKGVGAYTEGEKQHQGGHDNVLIEIYDVKQQDEHDTRILDEVTGILHGETGVLDLSVGSVEKGREEDVDTHEEALDLRIMVESVKAGVTGGSIESVSEATTKEETKAEDESEEGAAEEDIPLEHSGKEVTRRDKVPVGRIRRRARRVSYSSSSDSSDSSVSSASSTQRQLIESLSGLVKQSTDMVNRSVDRTVEMVKMLTDTVKEQNKALERFAERLDRMDGTKVTRDAEIQTIEREDRDRERSRDRWVRQDRSRSDHGRDRSRRHRQSSDRGKTNRRSTDRSRTNRRSTDRSRTDSRQEDRRSDTDRRSSVEIRTDRRPNDRDEERHRFSRTRNERE